MKTISLLVWFFDVPIIALCIFRLIIFRIESRRFDMAHHQRMAMMTRAGGGLDAVHRVRIVPMREHVAALRHGKNGPAILYGQVWHDTFPNPYL